MSAPQHSVNLIGLGMNLQKVEDILESICNTSGNDPFLLSDLRQEDNHFKEIVIDFENAGLHVVKVQRLQNKMKWKAYKGNRDIILEQRTKLDENYCLNERYLYHGTAAEIKDICELGLDDKLSGNGCFGQGIYFSDNPKKCTKYANRRDGDEGLILCARVILGDIKMYPKGKQDRTLRREPEKTGKFHGWRFYDSVQGCPKDFTEFVVYRAQQALIEYLITYSKSSTTKPNRSGGNVTCPNGPKVSAEQDSHHHLPSSMSNTSQFTDKSSKFNMPMMPKNQRSPDHLISASSIPSSTTVPDEDTSSSESDGEHDKDVFYHNKEASSSDEDGETQRNAKEDSDSECTGSGSDTDIDENLGGKEKNKNIKSFYSCGNAKKEEILLAQKRTEFTVHTGEYSEYLVETFLLASDFDVARAVDMYHQKKKKDAQKLTKPSVDMEEDEQKEDEATGGKSEPDFVQGKTVPEFDSPQWKQMSENDKEEVVNILVDNFLSITALSEAKAPLAREILKLTRYNLDQAIVSYYESI